MDPLAPVMFWIVPALLGQPFFRLYLLAEHTGCPMVDDMLANTRTTLTNRLVWRLAWNMPYHVEHHHVPAIPFYALPAVNAGVQDRLRVVAPGYWAFHHELLRLLRTDRPRLSDHPGRPGALKNRYAPRLGWSSGRPPVHRAGRSGEGEKVRSLGKMAGSFT